MTVQIPREVLDETRLAALQAYAILDTPAEAGFDDIVHLACRLCSVPVALVSFVDRERQWFKARVGFPPCETALDSSVCAHALANPDKLLVIPDLTADPRTATNPLVTGEPFIRFYAGAPLVASDGDVLGSLCVIDTKPRPGGLMGSQADDLRALARQIMSQLELRRAVASRDRARAAEARAYREREALRDTQVAALAAGGDLDATLGAVVDGAMRATPAAEGGVVELLDGTELEYHAARGTLAGHVGLRLPLKGSLAGHAASTRTPMRMTDAATDPYVRRSMVAQLRIRSAIVTPVLRGDAVLGVLKLQSSLPDAFTDEDLALLGQFAGAATAGLAEVRAADAQRAAVAGAYRQRAIFDSTTQFAIVVTDREGRVTDWNTGAERTLGWSAAEMVGQSADRFFTPEDRAAGQVQTEMLDALETGRATDERWHLRQDGTRFWASGEMMPLRDAAGAHRGFVKVLRDRTDEHLGGQALEASEARLRQAQEAGGIGTFELDVASGFVTVSAEFCRLYGLPVVQTLPLDDVLGLILPEDLAGLSTEAGRLDGRVDALAEYRIRRPDGAVRRIAREWQPVRDGNGRVTRWFGTVRDATERHEAQEALRASEAYWRGLFERLSEGFIVGEVVRGRDGRVADWRYLEVNAACGGLVGVDHRTVVGRTIREVFPGIEDEWVTDFAQVVDTGEARTFTRQVGTLRRWYEGRAFRLEAERFAVIFLEITDRVEAEARRAALLAFGDRLRDLNDIEAMTMAACEVLGTTLDVELVGYGEVDAELETITVERDWTTGGAASLAGTLRFRDFGTYVEDFKRGETVVVHDCRTDPRTREFAAALEERSARAFVNTPVFERGAFVGLLYVSTVRARDWSGEELEFIQEVGSRVRLATARVRAEEQQATLNGELAHRLKNTLSVVQSIASQTLRSVPDRGPVDALAQRISALGAAHDVLLRRSWTAAPIRTVVETVLEGLGLTARCNLVGPPVDLGPKATMSLSLVLHELATNAVKYGALSNDSGGVGVAWGVDASGDREVLVFDWVETGGPPVREPTRRGFGSRLVRTGLIGIGGVELAYAEQGFRAHMTAPLDDARKA